MTPRRYSFIVLALLLLLASCGGDSADEGAASNADAGADTSSPTDSGASDTSEAADAQRDADTPDADTIDALDADPLDTSEADTDEPGDTRATDTRSDAEPDDVDSDVCEGDACPPDCDLECPTGERRCDGERGVSVCEQDDLGCSRWVASEPCDDALICQSGVCVASCEASDTRCLDQETLQECEGGRLTQTLCPGGCDPATRDCFICPDGAWRCADDGDRLRLERCQGGTRWVLEDV